MRHFFHSIDISSLVFFRIAFGILGFIDIMASWTYKHLYKQSFDPANFQFKYYGFEWVQPFPEPFMSMFFIAILAAAVGIILGWRYRLCTTLFAIGFAYTFFLEKTYYLNHGYLFMILSFIMIFLPAHRGWSADVLRRPALRLQQIPWWPLLLLQFMMATVYFFGGIAKVNPDWLNGLPLKLWLRMKSDMWLLGPLWAKEATAYFMSYSGMLLDLFVVFFLIFRRTRPWAFGFVIFFHLTNMLLFQIGIFPWLSTTMTLLFFPPDFPRRFCNWLCRRIPRLEGIGRWWAAREERANVGVAAQGLNYSTRQQRGIIMALVVFALLQWLIPLRHHYFPGDVAWTEEGHRYAWRMMLRSKQGYGVFHLRTAAGGNLEKVKPREYLNKRQERKMYTHPDMILQFAHFLKAEYEKKGFEEVEVYADIKVRLNGRKYWPYVDLKVDLGEEEWAFFEGAGWVLGEGEENAN